MFPPEIWEMIFLEIDDPIELTRLQQVSRRWRDIITRILPLYDDEWEYICKDDLPRFWIYSSLKNMGYETTGNQFYDITLNSEAWKAMYIAWRKWQLSMPLKRPMNITDSWLKFSETERITCIDKLIDIVAVGSTEGVIYFYNFNDLDRPFFIAFHGQPIAEVHFWPKLHGSSSTKTDKLAVSTDINGCMKYWNFEDRLKLESSKQHYGRLLTRLSHHTYFSVWKGILSRYKWASGVVKRLWEFKLPLESNVEVVAIGCGHNHGISILTFDGTDTRQYCVTNTDSPQLDWNHSSDYAKLLPKSMAFSKLKQFYCHSGNVAVCLADGLLTLSLDDGPWFTPPFKSEKISSALLCNNGLALIIGLESGDIYIHLVNRHRDWIHLSFIAVHKSQKCLEIAPKFFRVFDQISENRISILSASEKTIELVTFDQRYIGANK